MRALDLTLAVAGNEVDVRAAPLLRCAASAPTHETQRLGGWRSSVMVERYAHLAPDHLAKAAHRLDPMLGLTIWLR